MKRMTALVLYFLVGCSAVTHERLREIEVEKETMQRYLTVCALAYPSQQKFCNRKYGARLHELICEEARLKGEKCTHVYTPD